MAEMPAGAMVAGDRLQPSANATTVRVRDGDVGVALDDHGAGCVERPPRWKALALGIPVVALFGPSDPAEWGPAGTKSEVLYKGLDCRRCFHPTCEKGEFSCMKQISVDEAFAAAARCLG